jgi:hypothetical protein
MPSLWMLPHAIASCSGSGSKSPLVCSHSGGWQWVDFGLCKMAGGYGVLVVCSLGDHWIAPDAAEPGRLAEGFEPHAWPMSARATAAQDPGHGPFPLARARTARPLPPHALDASASGRERRRDSAYAQPTSRGQNRATENETTLRA